MFERERRLLSILPRCAHASIQALLSEAVDDRHACVGTVASIQTFGSYAANFHPHVHALITEGAFHVPADGAPEFERMQWWDSATLNELFRRMVLRSLRKAERLRPETEQTLLSWEHSGFSVHATEPVLPDNPDRLEHLAQGPKSGVCAGRGLGFEVGASLDSTIRSACNVNRLCYKNVRL